jgi:hypothetical protein
MNQLSYPLAGPEYQPNGLGTALSIASTAAVIALAYHGYKRNESVGWAVVWAVVGGAFWPIAVPIAVAQGYGERA